MKVLTCNVRYFSASDGDNDWTHRKETCTRIIATQSADVICFQEMWHEQFLDTAAALPGYETYGMTDEPAGRNPVNCIFFRTNTYTRVSAGGYWLSETPHVPGSKSWDCECVRIANWVRLQDRGTGTEFRIVNTHLDHVGQVARENQALLLVDDAGAYAEDYPQILAGDMNCDAGNRAIEIFRKAGWTDTYGCVHGTEDPGHTYHAFLGPDHDPRHGKMDWILVRGKIKVLDAAIVTESVGGRFPSDHYFVSTTLSWE